MHATLSAAVPTLNNLCVSEIMLCLCSGEIYNNLLIFTDIKSLLKGVVVCELFWHKPQTLTVHCLWTGCVPTVCMYICCRWLSSQDIFHDLSCLWGYEWPCWRREGNAAFFRGAGPFGWEQSPWKENKAENSHSLTLTLWKATILPPLVVSCSY